MYSFESRVRYSECDEQGTLSLFGLINYLQDATIFHSEDIGRGISYMKERGIAWLIASWRIEITRLPRYCEQITVSTWCHSMGRRLASRNFTICDKDGSELVRADSLWFIFDFAKGRPVPIPDDQHVFLAQEPPLDMTAAGRKLSVNSAYVEAPALTVEEFHLDINRHVNNAQYLGMAVNALAAVRGSTEAGTRVECAAISIQYRQQALLGDLIVPRVHTADAAHTVDLVDTSGATYATVRIEPRS